MKQNMLGKVLIVAIPFIGIVLVAAHISTIGTTGNVQEHPIQTMPLPLSAPDQLNVREVTKKELAQLPELYENLRLAQMGEAVWDGVDVSNIQLQEALQKGILIKMLDILYRTHIKSAQLNKQIAAAKGLPTPQEVDPKSRALDTLESYCISSGLRNCPERRKQYALLQETGELKSIATGSNIVDAYHLSIGTLMR
jgi:hypothetical protein